MDSFLRPPVGGARLRRIASMSLAELGCRGRQEGSKWIERVRTAPGPRDAHETLRRHAPSLADAPALAELQRIFDERFFAGASTSAAAAHTRAHIDSVVTEANALLAGQFDLLGYQGLYFGEPIDWQLDPIWSRRAPMTHWSRIDTLDPAVVGDHKVVWELNRHQWMVRLAQATVLTGDERYGAHAIAAMLDWIAENPDGRGVNWASSLEVSFRLIAWTWVLALLRRHEGLWPEPALTQVLAMIHGHATHVHRYLSSYYSPNTHLTGEALGLLYAGTFYPQFTDAHRWRDVGASTLIAEGGRQVTNDGVYFEQSSCYQRYTCDFYLQFLMIAEQSGLEIPALLRSRVARMVEFLAAIATPDGRAPNIGDADGGWLLPLSKRDADDCRGTLAVAAVVLNRPDLAAETGDAPEALWLTGRQPASGDITPRQSRLFEEGGYALLQAGEHDMIVDVGPLGAYGHGHADLLSVQCRVAGEPCLVDPGTYGYTAEPVWREHFRSTAAHNTVTVDHRNQAEPLGPFGWKTRPAPTVLHWHYGRTLSVIAAEHNAFPGVIHRRRVMSVALGDQFVIIDDLLGDGSHTFQVTFQFAPMHVVLDGLIARATTPRGHALTIEPMSAVPLNVELTTGSTTPIRGWISPDYGRRTAAPVVIYSATSQLPVRIVTVLTPQA
jgi:hypothetical protein